MASLDCCMVCHSREIAFYVRDQERRLERCRQCDLVFVNPQPSSQDLSRLYEDSYFVGARGRTIGYEDYPGMKDELTAIAQERFDIVRTLHPGPGALVDVGTATGEFVEVAQEEGWQALGIEISEFASRIARQRNLPVLRGTLETVPVPPEAFDVVTMWDVLEHVRDPADELRRVHRLLRQGGYVLIATPNHRSLRSRLSGRWWWGYYVSREHLHYFAPRPLGVLLREAGFEPVLQRTYALDISLAMVAQLLRTAAGFPFAPPCVRHVPRSKLDRLQNYLADMVGGHVLLVGGQKR